MITVGIAIAAAAIALGVAMRTRLPASVLAIAAGVGLQALSAPMDTGVVRDGLLLSATFLVFAVGAEIERRPLRPFRPAALGLTFATLLLTGAVGVLLWRLLGLDALTAAYWVIALASGSTLLVFELLRRRERFFEPVGRVVTATTLAQDVVVIVALSLLAAFGPGGRESPAVLAGMVGLAVAAWALARWIAPFAMLRMGLDDEERLLFVLLVLFAFAAVARWTGNPLVTGAYFAGMAMSRFPVGGLTRGYLKSFSDFFTMIFYVMLGMVIVVPSPASMVAELAFVTAVLLLRPFVLLPLVRRSGLAVRSSIEAVTLLAQAGELAVIVALVGMELGHVGEQTLGVIAVVVVASTAVVPWISSDAVTWRLTHAYPFQGRRSLGRAPSGHVVLLGCGETGTAILKRLERASADVVVVDDDPAVVQALQERGVAVLRGDGADPQVLQAAGAMRARAVVSTMRRAADNAHLLRTLRGPEILVRTFSLDEAEGVRQLGGHPVSEAEVAAEALLEWHAGAAGDARPPE
ncbi:MAG: cation:proton antiporter [Myxococcota bacterium]